jgi:hypothetical protein
MNILSVLFLAAAVAQDKPFSGPQPGEKLEGFRVLAVNGADAGSEVDYIGRWSGDPMMLIFIHQLDRNVAALIQPCEQFAQEQAAAGLRTLFVYLAPEKIEGERRMQTVVKSLRLASPVGVSLDGVEGPGAYGLNKQVAVTVLIARNRTVTDNFAIVQPGTVDAPRVMAAAARHVGGRVRTAEEIQAERMRVSNPQGAARPGEMQPPDPPELANLLRRLIQLGNSETQVDAAIVELRGWTGSDPARRALLAGKLKTIASLRYGTEYAQKRIAELRVELER